MRPAEEAARAAALAGPLGELLPPVDFCCAYGSTLLHARPEASSMVDYILGVPDPLQWHSENLERNPDHYSGWMARLGPGAITRLADNIGVGVYFNPFVEWRDKRIKYGVVRMKDLAMDVLTWDRFYLSGRLQKPYDLYAQICSLSYMGDLRMLFAEDKNKVKKIVEGSFPSFQSMYRTLIQEYIAEGLLKTSSYGQQKAFHQDCGASATNELFSYLPWTIQRRLQGRFASNCEEMPTRASVSSKDVAATCVRKALRRRVMVSSARQAMSGLLASGGAVAARYLGKKISKAWKSRTV
ncbi:uncharacterized protein [Oryza sativa Japonica Group]|uniref:uncharacterized protein isoform X2 n=1 Tax=Oryza sativa subsp. japonica TaxID=39947 RepID=UPI0007754857|nr:phosphatidate cytidylyltransferase, mitochondrial isoform X2 [Oryza sativa Japonica Group]